MKRFWIIFFILVIAGCSTIGEFVDNNKVYIAVSLKKFQSVALLNTFMDDPWVSEGTDSARGRKVFYKGYDQNTVDQTFANSPIIVVQFR